MNALYMGHHHNSHQGPYTPSDGPSLPSLRVSSSQSVMPSDPDGPDLPSAPEEYAFSMQYGTAALYAQNSNPASHEEMNGSNVFSASETTAHLKSPLKSAHLDSSASIQDPSSAVFLDQPSGNGFGPELDPTVDSRYSENTYVSVFPGDGPMLSPTWNIPGSFKVFNAMDLDGPEQPYSGSLAPPAQALPPQNHNFAVYQNPGQTSGQSDQYTGHYPDQYPDQRASQYPSSQYTQANTPFDPAFNATLNPTTNPNTLNPNTLNAAFPNSTVDDSSSLDPDLSNLALDPHYLDSSHAFARSLSHSMAESPFSTDRSPQPSPSSYAFPASQGADAPDSVAFSESVLAPGTVLYPETASNGPQTSAFRDLESNRTSISLAANELSPLTTTTSFTASVSSHHSTQQSFFSAQQFWRSSMDLPPSSIHRASMDLYQRRRGSLESSNSGANAPVRSQRSLASYFPFMDRDRKSPIQNPSPPENWQPAMVSAPRHSIRSIFKTSNAPQSVEEEPERPVFSVKSEDDHLDGDEAQKKAKRTTRGLFKRFKQTKQEELKSEEMKQEDGLRFDDFGPVNSSQSDVQLANINMGSYEDAEMDDEPDYGALFSKVGKRKNFVMKNSKKDKEKEKTGKVDVAIKMEEAAGASFSSAENSESSHLSATTSRMSATSRETTENGPTSTFASASKRILGSRLMKKKNHVKNEPLSNVVEIDLQSLDLPENTEVIEKQASKSRTRGRKEDKAADLEDDSKIYICGYCSRRFKRQEHLKRHFRSLHTAEKPYNCSYCKKKFSRTDNLNQHVKVHKQEEEEQNM